MDRVAATMPSQAHAGAAQEAPDIGQWEGQDVPLVRPSSCIVKEGIPSPRRYLPTYLKNPGRNKQQEPPPPAQGEQGTSGGKTHRTGSSGTEQAGGAAAPQTGSSGDKRRPSAPDWIIRVWSSNRTRQTQDWIIWGRTTRSGHNPRGRNAGKGGLPPQAG